MKNLNNYSENHKLQVENKDMKKIKSKTEINSRHLSKNNKNELIKTKNSEEPKKIQKNKTNKTPEVKKLKIENNRNKNKKKINNNKRYKTEVNTPYFNNKIKNIIIQKANEKNNSTSQINSLKSLLNSTNSSNDINMKNINKNNYKIKNKTKNKNKREINNQIIEIDSTQNERKNKFYDYTFSQKSDNTNTNNYFTNNMNSVYMNNKSFCRSSGNLGLLIEENNKKIYINKKKEKMHSYSPKLRYNFTFIKNNKKSENSLNFMNEINLSQDIKVSYPDINLISENDNIFNYHYDNSSMKILDVKKNKNNKIKNLIKDIQFNANLKFKYNNIYNNRINNSINKINLNRKNKNFNINNISEDKIRFNSLREIKSMGFSFNFENKKVFLNNKSYDSIMPPNDFKNIYRKNFIYSQLINK